VKPPLIKSYGAAYETVSNPTESEDPPMDKKVNRTTYAVAHIPARAVVLVGGDDQSMLAMTPDAARALATELNDLATLAEGQETEKRPDAVAVETGPLRNLSGLMKAKAGRILQ
jgi:hypothetical protein